MPENKFVSQFTIAESVVVERLKEDLNDILNQAFGDTQVYNLWGVPLVMDSEDERLKVVLVKFARARNLDFDAAKAMLINTLKWRKEFSTDTILDEEFDQDIFNETIGFLCNTDKQGRPVTYNFYGGLDQNTVFADVNRFIRWRVQLMEKGISHVDFINIDSMVQVHDYKGVSIFGRTANAKQAINTIIKLLQDNYPEFLSTKLFVNIPKWGTVIFRLVRPLLSEATLKKFVICASDNLNETLLTYISQDSLPPIYSNTFG